MGGGLPGGGVCIDCVCAGRRRRLGIPRRVLRTTWRRGEITMRKRAIAAVIKILAVNSPGAESRSGPPSITEYSPLSNSSPSPSRPHQFTDTKIRTFPC
ncbi:hypothetical protein CDL15_Pgr023682 [Punica granatum]|uniref:Uncharacterized protein n=1 Tax=Punica granatum TaxID=22663 RepID=A0A218XM49_PUNGR|nr:hypothetical protein CDL15_Pgr023682 [Punica granatum]PKI65251.1 hypothetical protein CRG98_014400 [Punica granatum]